VFGASWFMKYIYNQECGISMQWYLSSFYYLFLSCSMLWWYDYLQMEIYIQWKLTQLTPTSTTHHSTTKVQQELPPKQNMPQPGKETRNNTKLLHNKLVWLGALSWCRNHRPGYLLHSFLWTVSGNLRKTCTQKWPLTLCPGSMSSWCIKLSISTNSGNFLTAPRIWYYMTRLLP
jgi:hypothetical protein